MVPHIGYTAQDGPLFFSNDHVNSEIAIELNRYEYQRALLNFDASKGSPIYGDISTVQPPALRTLACIKS